jgi:hypothetical protein
MFQLLIDCEVASQSKVPDAVAPSLNATPFKLQLTVEAVLIWALINADVSSTRVLSL